MKRLAIIGAVVLGIAFIIVFVGVSTSNREITLRSQIVAQKQLCEASYDKLWKIISQKAQVAEKYKETFKDIYPQLISSRYSNEGSGVLMKFITESNPNFDVSLYKDLMSSIEAERTSFLMDQKKLMDLSNQHRITLSTFPGSLFVGGRDNIEITVVSSDNTKEVMRTGKENNIDVFNSK